MIVIRPYCPTTDSTGLLNLINEGYASDPLTPEQFAGQESRRPPDLPFMRFVAVDADGAILGQAVVVGGHDLREGHVRAFVRVALTHRRRGVGSQLMGALIQWAQGVGLSTLEASASAGEGGAVSIAFMERTGWQEVGQVYFSRLKLSGLDLSPHRSALDAALAKGFRFETLERQGEGDALLQRYHTFLTGLERDVPGRGPITPAYPIWREQLLTGGWRPEHILLAVHDDRWAAVSTLEVKDDGSGYTGLTAVDSAYRGHGLGLATKVAALELAISLGLQSVTTYNHANNAPMLAVNRKFGYVTENTIRQFAYGL